MGKGLRDYTNIQDYDDNIQSALSKIQTIRLKDFNHKELNSPLPLK